MSAESWLAAAGDLLLGATCAGCRAAWWSVCPSCRGHVAGYLPRLVHPDPAPDGFPPTAAAAPYDEVLRGLVSAHKEEPALTLTPFLAGRLAVSVELVLATVPIAPSEPVLLVPVPSSPAAVRRRGFDATWALARHVTRRLRDRRAVRPGRLLVPRPGVQDQTGLGAAARRANLSGRFRLRRGRPVGIERVLVVDDVVTTGASLTEATRALTEAGWAVLGAATVAATERRRPPAMTGHAPT